MKILRYMVVGLMVVALALAGVVAFNNSRKADEALAKADQRIKEYALATVQKETELETVSLSYEEYLAEKKAQLSEESTTFVEEDTTSIKEDEVDVYSMDVWTLGRELYGIPDYDTTRSLILITFEGYGAESPLSYYVACCCWTRATNGYFGYSDLYSAFGGADIWNYGEWLDNNGYADYAVDVLRQCYLTPMYVMNCNGMEMPSEYIYAEDVAGTMIYVWN